MSLLIQVHAVHVVETEEFLVECSDCGLLGAYTADTVDEECLSHLEAHNVDTTEYRREEEL